MSMAALLARRARGVRAHGVSARGLTPRLLRHSSGSAWPRIDAASVVDDATAAAFRRDGAVKLEALASPRWVEALRAAAERNLADPGPLCDEHAQAAGTGGRFHDDQFLHHRHAVRQPRVEHREPVEFRRDELDERPALDRLLRGSRMPPPLILGKSTESLYLPYLKYFESF